MNPGGAFRMQEAARVAEATSTYGPSGVAFPCSLTLFSAAVISVGSSWYRIPSVTCKHSALFQLKALRLVVDVHIDCLVLGRSEVV